MTHPRLQDMGAIITGGAGALGAATAQAFLDAGARVVLADINEAALARTSLALRGAASEVAVTRCDISDATDCERLVAFAEGFFGRPIDIFVANAGIPYAGPLAEASEHRIRQVIDTNVTGSIFSAQAALRSLRSSPRASLLFTASLQSTMGRADRSVYTASKHAIAGLVKSLALEMGPQGVRVNGIAPTLVDTPFLHQACEQAGLNGTAALEKAAQSLPLGHIVEPQDFAHAAVFLASQEARCITGHLLMLDCGSSAGKF